jgi:hypothetical protein
LFGVSQIILSVVVLVGKCSGWSIPRRDTLPVWYKTERKKRAEETTATHDTLFGCDSSSLVIPSMFVVPHILISLCLSVFAAETKHNYD